MSVSSYDFESYASAGSATSACLFDFSGNLLKYGSRKKGEGQCLYESRIMNQESRKIKKSKSMIHDS